ncbi:MAG: alpha/beta hydrolase, partial [Mycobacteriales bacterium]
MVGPTSFIFFAILVLASAGWLTALVRARQLALKITSGMLAFLTAMVFGVAWVNRYYDYYRNWGDLFRSPRVTTAAGLRSAVAAAASASNITEHGTLISVTIAGAQSGITRSGYVYLPAQYGAPAYAHLRFPVLEILHGWPGTPSDVIDFLQATHLYEAELRARRVGPMILVIPDSGGARGQPSQECVNSASGVLDDTYLTTDLRSWVLARYRAATDGASWGLLGYSEGGFCAANLALRHPSLFGAAISLDGYFQPEVDDTTGNI